MQLHRLLAIRRAEAEGLLKVSISPDDEECVERLERQFVRSNNPADSKWQKPCRIPTNAY